MRAFSVSAVLTAALMSTFLPARSLAQRPAPPEVIPDAQALVSRIETELKVTKPDFMVFVPRVNAGAVSDTGNEHFLVFDGPDGALLAVWTQSSAESQPDQHIAFARSGDEGATWSRPTIIAGPKTAGGGPIASWAYPMVSRSGRIYVLYSQHAGRFDTFFHHTGWLHGIFSDDNGRTWSNPQQVPVSRSINDNPDKSDAAEHALLAEAPETGTGRQVHRRIHALDQLRGQEKPDPGLACGRRTHRIHAVRECRRRS